MRSWEVASVVVGPLLAVLYCVTASSFNWMWNEQPLGYYVAFAIPRITVSLFVVLLCIVILFNTSNEYAWPFLAALFLSGIITCYVIYATRIEVVQGGPPPGSETLSNASGKVILVTGANSGIGKETARLLYQAGCNVIVACRGQSKAEDTVREFHTMYFNDHENVELFPIAIDLNSLESVRTAAAIIQTQYKQLDVIICNAGVMMKDQKRTVDGFDMVWQANYLGHALLCHLLLPLLKTSSADPRIIHVTSSTYPLVGKRLPFYDLQCQKGRPYTLFGQYAVSKCAQILWCQYTSRQGIFTAAVHPGLVRTDVVRNMPRYLQCLNRAFDIFLRVLQKTPTQGAWGSIHAALAPDLPSGRYWVNRKPAHLSSPAVQSETDGEELYEVTMSALGIM